MFTAELATRVEEHVDNLLRRPPTTSAGGEEGSDGNSTLVHDCSEWLPLLDQLLGVGVSSTKFEQVADGSCGKELELELGREPVEHAEACTRGLCHGPTPGVVEAHFQAQLMGVDDDVVVFGLLRQEAELLSRELGWDEWSGVDKVHSEWSC